VLRLGERVGNSQAQPEALAAARLTIESLEYPVPDRGREALPVILDGDERLSAFRRDANADLGPSVQQRVLDEVLEDPTRDQRIGDCAG
jgi:hypothetical protein